VLFSLPSVVFGQIIPLAFWQGPPVVQWLQKAEGYTLTSGHLIVCDIEYGGSTSNIQSVSDSNGNTYMAALDILGAEGGDRMAIYYKENVVGGGGANTVKVTVTLNSARTFVEIGCHEFSGVPLSGTLDHFGSGGTATATSSITTGPIQSIYNKEFVFAHMAASNSGGAGAGFTSISTLNGNSTEFMTVRWPANTNVLFTQSPAGGWEAVFATFRSL